MIVQVAAQWMILFEKSINSTMRKIDDSFLRTAAGLRQIFVNYMIPGVFGRLLSFLAASKIITMLAYVHTSSFLCSRAIWLLAPLQMYLNIFSRTPRFIETGLPSSNSTPASPPSPASPSMARRTCSSVSDQDFVALEVFCDKPGLDVDSEW